SFGRKLDPGIGVRRRGGRVGAFAFCAVVVTGSAFAECFRVRPSLLLKPVSDPTFSEIIGRHLD
ncbi:MAG: hypothetical protein ACERIE_05875, partial [Methyloceanibacter sp.]